MQFPGFPSGFQGNHSDCAPAEHTPCAQASFNCCSPEGCTGRKRRLHFSGEQPQQQEIQARVPLLKQQRRLEKFYCLSEAGNTECLWRKAPRQELAKKQITGIAFIMAVSIAPVMCLTALAPLFSYLVYLTFSFFIA